MTPPEPVEAREPMPVEDIIGAFVGSLREPDVMAALSDEGYTVCGPDCGCSCLRADTARVPDHDAVAYWRGLYETCLAATTRQAADTEDTDDR